MNRKYSPPSDIKRELVTKYIQSFFIKRGIPWKYVIYIYMYESTLLGLIAADVYLDYMMANGTHLRYGFMYDTHCKQLRPVYPPALKEGKIVNSWKRCEKDSLEGNTIEPESQQGITGRWYIPEW